VKFVVPNEETIERSIAVARVILEDGEARSYVAAGFELGLADTLTGLVGFLKVRRRHV
jgi:hypothetical protein